MTKHDLKSVAREAIALAGGNQAVADRIGKRRQSVEQWVRIPTHWIPVMEELSGMTRYELRPDVYGTEPPRRLRTRELRPA